MKKTTKKKFKIRKHSGNTEPFSRLKLYRSLRRAGLKDRECRYISSKIEQEVHEGSTTQDIYRRALGMVKKSSLMASANYSLKKALFDLGPEGYFFEDFVARYFEEIGFEAQTCDVYQGRHVKHEVDVTASLNGRRYFVECKFHNRTGIKNDIKTALYVKARWDDLREGPEGKNLAGFYLASNTSYSLDAITYATGTGLNLLGLNAPVELPFIETLKKLRLYPITSLRGLSRMQKRELLKKKIVMVKDLLYHRDFLMKLGLNDHAIERVLTEADYLTGDI